MSKHDIDKSLWSMMYHRTLWIHKEESISIFSEADKWFHVENMLLAIARDDSEKSG